MRIVSVLAWTGLVGGGLGLWLAAGLGGPGPGPQTRAEPSARHSGPIQQTLHFERNDGQAAAPAQFVARGRGYALYLEPREATLALRAAPAGPEIVRMKLLGASADASLAGEQVLAARANYLVGGPARWRSGVPLYAQVRAREVYAGIDLVYYGNQGQLEYDFIVAPGADPRQIRLRFEGARPPRLDDDGALRLAVGNQELVQNAPMIYQDRDGSRATVPGKYVLDGGGAVAIEVAAYDTALPLVIDPVLVYSTLLGGGSEDAGHDLAVDLAGNAYVAGRTSSLDLPAAEGAQDTTLGGGGWSDAFVAKFDPTGAELVYLTYLGGDSLDYANAIAVDTLGNAYVAGAAELGGFPTTAGAYGDGADSGAFVAKLSADGASLLYAALLPGAAEARALALAGDGTAYVGGYTPNPNGDAFVARLSADGSQLERYLEFGGDDLDVVSALANDALGQVYAAGFTIEGSVDFPTTAGAYDESHNGGWDAFVVKLDGAGTGFTYATLLGGSDPDSARALAVDAAGNAYVGGVTGDGSGPSLGDFPTTPGAFQRDFEGQVDGFVAKLDASGSTLVWSTLINADTPPEDDSYEDVADLALTPAGLLYVVGTIGSEVPFPVTAGAFDESPDGGDAYLLLLSPDGSTVVYATYLGGNFGDSAYGLAVDATGGAYVTGNTLRSDRPDPVDFPTTEGAYDRTHNDLEAGSYAGDAFVVRLHPLVDSVAQFPIQVLSVAADATSAVIEIVRDGDADGVFEVDYTAVTDTIEGEVIVDSGTVAWPDGESGAQEIEIPLSGDTIAKSTAAQRTVRVSLSQPNGRLGAARAMTVAIGSADGPRPAATGGAFGAWLLLGLGLVWIARRR